MRHATFASAAALIVAAALAGCAQSSKSLGDDIRRPEAVYSGEVPAFSGPYASEFEDAYRSTNSDIVHKILDKEFITDQDYAEVSSAYIACMANKGFTVRVTGPRGESVTEAGEESHAANEECSDDFGIIAGLRNSLLRNPENRNEEEIVAACLVDKNVAPPGYTARDYEANLQSQTFPYSLDDPGFSKCVNDPLGLASGK